MQPLDPRVEIGHVRLRVADLERALAFYAGSLGFEVTQRQGASAAFLGAGGFHHHVALYTAAEADEARSQPGRIASRSAIRIASRSATR